ncbi:MAG: winged helix-turn-helix domain-containing protein [Acidobacteriota bacterium]
MSLDPRERTNGGAFGPDGFAIGDRTVQPDLNRVIAPGRTFQLEPKVMGVLLRLAERWGEVVSKDELFETVWSGTHVTEDVLTRAVGELRKVFGDDAAHPRVIETIRKRGYRLIAPRPAAEGAPRVSSAPRSGIPSSDPPPLAPASPLRRFLPLFALLLLISVAAAVWLARASRTPRDPVRAVPLTSSPGNESDPAVSPDGSRVAFNWNGGSGKAEAVWLQLVDAEKPLKLTDGPSDYAPSWSPDGQRIAFSRVLPGGAGCSISVVSALGGAVRTLAPCGVPEGQRLAWAPDGRSIVYPRRNADGVKHLFRLDLESGAARELTSPSAPAVGDYSPAFSPDGRTIAFLRASSAGVDDVFTVPSAGGEPRRVTADNRDVRGADWSRDGRDLFFSSNRAGLYSLWRVSASGGEPRFVAGGGSKIKYPSSARARSLVAYEDWIYEINLWSYPLADPAVSPASAAAAPLALTSSNEEWNLDPRVSPDGRRVAYTSTRSGTYELWSSGSDGTNPVRLTSFRGGFVGSPRWSPDGRTVLFVARPSGQADVYRVDAAGGPVSRLTTGPGDELAPAWSADGTEVYFASRRSGAWEVWELALATSSVTRVTEGGGYAAAESADGRTLYYSRADAAGLWKKALGTEHAPAERVSAGPEPSNATDWQLGPGGFFYRASRDGERPDVVRFQPADGSPARDLPTPGGQDWYGFAVSPDGARVVYSRVDRHSSDIKMLENLD